MAILNNTYTNYFVGTDDNNLINNYVPAFVHGRDGNDQIANVAQVAFINGDDDNDAIVNYAFNSQVYLDGGEDNDYIINAGSGIATLYGGYDVYDYEDDNDILVGSPYAVDFFLVGEYCGYDVIQNYDANDAIFCATTSGYLPYVYKSGNDVVVQGVAMTVIVQGAAGKQFNFGYLNSYGGVSFDTTEEVAQTNLWGNSNLYAGTIDSDNIFVSRVDGDDLIFNAAQDDVIHFYDAALSDIVATGVSENSIAIAFNTGETTYIENSGNVSSTFKLASGESYVYNRTAGEWQRTE